MAEDAGGHDTPSQPYRSARRPARWAQALIGLVGFVSVLGIWATNQEVELLRRIDNGLPVTFDEAVASDQLVGSVATWFLLAYITAGIVFFAWLRRSVGNLETVRSKSSEVPFRLTPGWAVGWYFVPFANLVRPYQVMRELHDQSSPEGEGSPLVGWWWAFFLGSNIIGSGAANWLTRDPSIAELIRADLRSMVSDVLTIIAAVLAVALIERVVQGQERRVADRGVA